MLYLFERILVEILQLQPKHCKNTVISPNFLVWKFCGNAQFPHSVGRIYAKLCFSTKYTHQENKWNYKWKIDLSIFLQKCCYWSFLGIMMVKFMKCAVFSLKENWIIELWKVMLEQFILGLTELNRKAKNPTAFCFFPAA